MIHVRKRLKECREPGASLTLSFEARQKSRLRTHLDDGREVALLLPRGPTLRAGDQLGAEDGLVIEVRAAKEKVSTARTDDPIRLARACYHLGNRHVPLQIGQGWVRYLRDHVLDAMVRQLELAVKAERAPFEPEGGAYEHAHKHPRAESNEHAHA